MPIALCVGRNYDPRNTPSPTRKAQPKG